VKLKVGIGIALFLLLSTAIYFWIQQSRKSTTVLDSITRGSIVNSVYGIGTLTAERSFAIKSGVTSTIHKLYVREGQKIEKGTRLVDLEGIGSFQAPFSGIVVSIPFKEGETVYSQAVVVTLVDPSETYLLVVLEQQGALALKPTLAVKVSFDGLRDQVFDGLVESIYSSGAEFLARISLKTLPKNILPGMTADVAIILEEKKDALLFPIASLEGKMAVVSRKGKIIRVPVKLGLIDSVYAEITEGDIQVGDQAAIVKRVIK
jgi:macrolide-specific efflux system membrane fusion protein